MDVHSDGNTVVAAQRNSGIGIIRLEGKASYSLYRNIKGEMRKARLTGEVIYSASEDSCAVHAYRVEGENLVILGSFPTDCSHPLGMDIWKDTLIPRKWDYDLNRTKVSLFALGYPLRPEPLVEENIAGQISGSLFRETKIPFALPEGIFAADKSMPVRYGDTAITMDTVFRPQAGFHGELGMKGDTLIAVERKDFDSECFLSFYSLDAVPTSVRSRVRPTSHSRMLQVFSLDGRLWNHGRRASRVYGLTPPD